ncbi:S-methyl-5-thioribose-1-phosphate isomerase [candidate division BRC1 bacterium HGW-BRC1-1]|jgi:methylthioribose-1-phosphate isomerase|nr:MAG: S-methyl-5-thioribose-1-phosphate isomerase [candidate division BRC1 bacterium HGW-BRC1-1]
MTVRTLYLDEGRVHLIDQTLLPSRYEVIEIKSVDQMWEAIRALRVRGAPAIGIAAAFGVWIAVRDSQSNDPVRDALQAADHLATSRPTAVNLFWALDRMRRIVSEHCDETDGKPLREAVLKEAQAMLAEDAQICREIGRHGASLLHDGSSILTHCNAGGLAASEYGTALAPVYWALEHDRKMIQVYADETRPLLQGARLTAWELSQAGIGVTLICDNMAGVVMAQGKVDMVIVGTDRVAANGDFANKIGTYTVAVLAREHNIPFYVAAPLSSVDMTLANGSQIPIEERPAEEVTHIAGKSIAPSNIRVYNPAFDVTPHRFVTAFITEKGIVRPPFGQGFHTLFEQMNQGA